MVLIQAAKIYDSLKSGRGASMILQLKCSEVRPLKDCFFAV